MILLSFCADCTWELLPMLLGAWMLGWLLWSWVIGSRFRAERKTLQSELSQVKATNTSLEKDLSLVRHEKENLAQDFRAHKTKYNDLLLRLNTYEENHEKLLIESQQNAESINLPLTEEPIDMTDSFILDSTPAPDGEAPEERINFAAAFHPEQLQVIEGIGPKIEGLLKAADIQSWEELAETPLSRLQEVLLAAGPRYRVHDPSSWAKQANLAQNGNWAALVAAQRSMSGGKNIGKAPANNQTKVEKMAAKILGITLYEPHDLKLIEGIGPKIEALLKADGIENWAHLAQAKVENLQAILRKAGDHYRLADPTTWPRQAGLAVAKKWKELEEYQAYLQGGKG